MKREFGKGDEVYGFYLDQPRGTWRIVSWYYCQYEKDYFYSVESLQGDLQTNFWGKNLRQAKEDCQNEIPKS